MKKIYLVTGANGHLGSAVCTALRARQDDVRALVLPGENTAYLRSLGVEISEGDVTKPEDLEKFFEVSEDSTPVVIHAAGIVDIACKRSPLMEQVNVEGTRNVLDACKRHAVSKLVYVSSVHAIPELPKNRVISEVSSFSPDLVRARTQRPRQSPHSLCSTRQRKVCPRSSCTLRASSDPISAGQIISFSWSKIM